MNDSITPKQLDYLRLLISKTGVGDPEYLGSWAKPWLSMKERDGRLSRMPRSAATKLIDGLKEVKATQERETREYPESTE